MRRAALPLFLRLSLLWAAAPVAAATHAPADLDRYNVLWTTPSRDASGAMPIGNGEVGLSVWVEEDGDLQFYISRTDAWSEACRLLKLGKIRVHFSPNPFVKGARFRQELKLRDGRIDITAGAGADAVKVTVFVDAQAPVIHILGESAQPLSVRAALEDWRTEKKLLQGEELSSSWTMQNAPTNIQVWEAADVVDAASRDAVVWYHRNEHSVVPLTLKHQSLERFSGLVQDPLLHRTFGGRLAAAGFVKVGGDALQSVAPVRRFSIQIATHTAQTDTPAAWLAELTSQAGRAARARAAARSTAVWWHAFWDRSWVFVEGDRAAGVPENPPPRRIGADSKGAPRDPAPPSQVTQAFLLQRWMSACAGRGQYPIKFNGSIFTVDPQFTGGPKFNADWRRWGDCFWWQNSRFPYFAMLANGDFDGPPSLFRLYRAVLPLCEARAQSYYGAGGAYFPETMTIFGTYANQDYGWDRAGHPPGEVLSPWWCYAWQQGLELVMLMADYYDYTGDDGFLANDLVPMAHAVLGYFDTRFPRDADGKLVLTPTQAVETYWHGVTNDTPAVAGLNAVVPRLLALPPGWVPAAERAFWAKLKAETPPLAVRTEGGKNFVPPARDFDPRRSNVENPELYAVWPFRLFGVGEPDLATGVETFERRVEQSMRGWSYDGQCAAILGLTDEARRQILSKARNANPNHRFPALWGPNYDWLPDQDHGSNILLTLQNMLLGADGRKIHLLPAWPKDWDVRFKLRAPYQTIVECEYRGGKVVSLRVTPASRRSDVVREGD